MAVRRAITQAIDKKDLYAALFPGYPVPDTAACSPAPPGTYWRDESHHMPAFDADAAAKPRSTLPAGPTRTATARATRTAGSRARGCTLARCNPARQLTLEKVKSAIWPAVGITANVNLADAHVSSPAGMTPPPDDRVQHLSRDLRPVALRVGPHVRPVRRLLLQLSTDQFPDVEPHDGGNTSRFSNPDMDAALDVLKPRSRRRSRSPRLWRSSRSTSTRRPRSRCTTATRRVAFDATAELLEEPRHRVGYVEHRGLVVQQ